jgi:hypothetical protein
MVLAGHLDLDAHGPPATFEHEIRFVCPRFDIGGAMRYTSPMHIILTLMLAILPLPAPNAGGDTSGAFVSLVGQGVAKFYAPNVMEMQLDYRSFAISNRPCDGCRVACPQCLDGVALLTPEWIGKRVYLQRPAGSIEGPFIVADCATDHHRTALLAHGWIVDVGNRTARHWGMRGPLDGVKVYAWEPGPASKMAGPIPGVVSRTH